MGPEQGQQMKSRSHGFTILEMAVVVAILSILAGLSIPPILKWVRSSEVNEAKSVLNTAIAECLQEFRTNPTGWKDVKPSSLDRALPGSYQFQEGKDTCAEIALEDTAGTKALPDLRFIINESGKVAKTAIVNDPAYERAAKTFGPSTLSASAISINNCLSQRTTCLQGINEFLASGVNGASPKKDWTGECKYPPDPTAGCTEAAWAFRKTKYSSQEAYNKAVDDALGETCKQERKKLLDANHTGETPANVVALGCPSSWWHEGDDLGSKDAYDAKVIEVAENKCIQDRETARTSNYKGKYGPFSGPAECGKVMWMCQGTILENEDRYKDSPCGVTCKLVTTRVCDGVEVCTGRKMPSGKCLGGAGWQKSCRDVTTEVCE